MTLRLIVPGASGFIGRNLILSTPTDWEVVALYHTNSNFPVWVKTQHLSHVVSAHCDLADEVAVRGFVDRFGNRFDACVFLAANGDPAYSVTHPLLDLRATISTFVNFMENIQVENLVYFSSGAVYDGLSGLVSPAVAVSPQLPYAISNLACEHYARSFTQRGQVGKCVNLRFFGAYGPFEPSRKLYTRLVQRFAFEGVPQFTVRGDGHNYVDAMYVEDAVRGILNILESDHRNLTLDFCSGAPMTINDLVKLAAETFGLAEVKIEHEGVVPEYIKFHASADAIDHLFHFRPKTALAEGLQRFAEWIKHRDESLLN